MEKRCPICNHKMHIFELDKQYPNGMTNHDVPYWYCDHCKQYFGMVIFSEDDNDRFETHRYVICGYHVTITIDKNSPEYFGSVSYSIEDYLVDGRWTAGGFDSKEEALEDVTEFLKNN